MKIVSEAVHFLEKIPELKALNFRRKIWRMHELKEEIHVSDKSQPIYYIISYDDPQSSGWTVWERVVLYGSIYAEDHRMIPVVDMKNFKSIYQTDDDYEKINIWDKYYIQPGGVSLDEALKSNNYILGDTSPEWFSYIRMRKPRKLSNNEYIKSKYRKYINLRNDVIEECENKLKNLIPNYKPDIRILSVKVRGTDYITYNHTVQPKVDDLVRLAKEIFVQYHCDYYFVSTEDPKLFCEISSRLPLDKQIYFNSGNAINVNGFVGPYMTNISGAHKAAMDYLTTLYLIDKSCCLIGGLCGATIVAKYRKKPSYEYINIIDTHEHY